MKRHIKYFMLLVAVVMSAVACKQLDKLTMFNLNYDYDFTIPATTLSGLPVNLASPEIETNSDEQFRLNNTQKDLIERVTLTQLELTAKDRSDYFSFAKSVEVYLRADGLPEILIAWEFEVPEDIGHKLSLETSNADLAPYLKKDKIGLRIKATTDEPIYNEIPAKVETTFHVDAKILGL